MQDLVKKRDLIFTIISLIGIFILLFVNTGYENSNKNIHYEKGEVIEVDNTNLQHIAVITIGKQDLKIKIKSGAYKDSVFRGENVLNGQKSLDKIFCEGDKVLTIITTENQKVTGVRAAEYFRTEPIIVLCIFFIVCLTFFAGFTGIRAVISFVFTALVFWKIMLPMFLNGYSPLWVGIMVCVITTTVVILLVSGTYYKGITALLGSLSGIIFTAVIAILSSQFFKIPGTVQDYSESLIYSGFSLNLSDIFLSTIFISASGALMDVATDIAAAIDELKFHNPNLTKKQLILSGFKIGRPVIGSATTTLLFAYSGGYMFAFMAFMAKGMPLEIILNSNYISAEIFHTLCGSLGLVMTAPMTAVIGGMLK